jgi:hypothetical protein
MPTTELIKKTITVKFRNNLKEGKKGKYGSIKTTDGESYLAQQDIWETLEPDGIYSIDYERSTGEFPSWIRMVTADDGDVLTTPVRATPPPQSTQKAYAKQQAGGSNLDAIICGMLKSFIEVGKVGLNRKDIVEAKKICREAWLDEFGDEIPY